MIPLRSNTLASEKACNAASLKGHGEYVHCWHVGWLLSHLVGTKLHSTHDTPYLKCGSHNKHEDMGQSMFCRAYSRTRARAHVHSQVTMMNHVDIR